MRAVLASLVFLCAYGLLLAGGREFYSCPPLQDGMVGICSEECSDDTDCQNSEKCCSNGCGHVCTRAVRIPHYDPPADTDGAPVCPILHDQISNTSLIGSYIPQCSADGSFSPIQCHGSTGYCWCVHVQTGEPVSGVVQFSRPPCTNCTYRGDVYYTGQTFPASSNSADCNQCTCMSDGSVTCTQMPVPCPITTTTTTTSTTSTTSTTTTPSPVVEQFFSCPPVDDDVVGICSEECSDDSDCTGGQKCCSNGCGHTCRTPVAIPYVPPRPLTTCPEPSDVPCVDLASGGSCGDTGCGEGMMCCENLCASAVCLRSMGRPCQSILDQRNQTAALLGEYIPQCDGDGLFQPMQCHSHYCWCVDPSSGRPTSDISPSENLDRLEECSGCTYNGQQFADGEAVESINGCTTCFCSGGMVACAESESLCGGPMDDSDLAWWPVLLIVGGVVAIILTIIAVIMVVVVVVLMRRNKFHHRRLKETTTFTAFQDADIDFKEGVESIELKVPLEDSEPVKT